MTDLVTIEDGVPVADVNRRFLTLIAEQVGPLRVRAKARSRWWNLLPRFSQDRQHTTLGWTLWLAEGEPERLAAVDGLPMLGHEARHWQQRRERGRWGFLMSYLFPHQLAAVLAVLSAAGWLCGAWQAGLIALAGAAYFAAPQFRMWRARAEVEAFVAEVAVAQIVWAAQGVRGADLVKATDELVTERAATLTRGYWLPADATSKAWYLDRLEGMIESERHEPWLGTIKRAARAALKQAEVQR